MIYFYFLKKIVADNMGFDDLDGDSPIMDDPNLENYNVNDKA